MDMELIKQKINYCECVFNAGDIHEECCELIVPDSSPDMIRIVTCGGNVLLKEKSVQTGKIVLNGMVTGNVLFVAENDPVMHKIEVNMPFTHVFESANINEESQCVVDVDLISLEAREINSRKIALRAHISFETKCYEHRNIEITQDICDRDAYGIEIQTKANTIYMPMFIKEKSFTIIDDIDITGTDSTFASLLKSEVSLDCSDKKTIGNKVVLKGVAHIKYCYNTKNGATNVATHNLPYSQIIDVDDFEENYDMQAKMNIRALEIEPSHDMTGDVRYISVNILVDTALIAYAKEEVSSVNDLYSTSHSLKYGFNEIKTCKMRASTTKRIAVNDNVETANKVKKILDTSVKMEPVGNSGNKILTNAQISILYIGENGDLYSVQRRCNVECALESDIDGEICCEVTVSGENATGNGNQITVHFIVDYVVNTIEKYSIDNLTNLLIGEKLISHNQEASVIIKHIYTEQPIWNIAKKYNTTVDEIAAANALDFGETVAAGSMLLIPCGR